jgi:hypothetical protein
MENKISLKLKIYRILASLTVLFGAILIIYMIRVEDEPGALPLLLIIAGTVWLFTVQYRIKRHLRNK